MCEIIVSNNNKATTACTIDHDLSYFKLQRGCALFIFYEVSTNINLGYLILLKYDSFQTCNYLSAKSMLTLNCCHDKVQVVLF